MVLKIEKQKLLFDYYQIKTALGIELKLGQFENIWDIIDVQLDKKKKFINYIVVKDKHTKDEFDEYYYKPNEFAKLLDINHPITNIEFVENEKEEVCLEIEVRK